METSDLFRGGVPMKGKRVLSQARSCMTCFDHEVPTDEYGYTYHYCGFHGVKMLFSQLKDYVCPYHNWRRD